MKDGVNMMDMPEEFWPEQVIVRGLMKHPNGKNLELSFMVSAEDAEHPMVLKMKFKHFRMAFWQAVNTEEVV